MAVGLRFFERMLGLVHVVAGIWLMYLTFAVAVNYAAGFHWTT